MLSICRGKIENSRRIEEIIGYEGQAAKFYFRGLSKCIEREFQFNGRSRRPPKDEFNSMISLGYSILMNELYCKNRNEGVKSILPDLYIEMLKSIPHWQDMMEEWRAVVVDATVMSMINGHEISKEDFVFNLEQPGCYLTKTGLKLYLNKLERKFQTEIRYLKYVDYPVSFRRGILLQMEQVNQKQLRREMLLCMNQLLFDDEEYYFQITDELESDRQFILIIYDIVDNKRRTKFAKLLEGYGKRFKNQHLRQCFQKKNYYKLIDQIPAYIDRNGEDSVRVYKITGKGKSQVLGNRACF